MRGAVHRTQSGPDQSQGQCSSEARMVPLAGLEPALLAEPHFERSEEHTSELQSLMRTSYAVFCLKKKTRGRGHAYSLPRNRPCTLYPRTVSMGKSWESDQPH